MTAARAPRVYTIAPGVPYLSTFARALVDGEIIPGFSSKLGPLALASATIYVPTRRAARGLAHDFAQLSTSGLTLLPQIVPLGQMDAVETSLMFDGQSDDVLAGIPDAISDMQRRLDLTTLILRWTASLQSAARDAERAPLIAPGPAQAWSLAKDLAALIDEMTIEGVEWERINHLAPPEFDDYWKQTLRFLQIATTIWPQHLKELDLVDRAERTALLIEAEVARIQETASDGPVIAIGSTGSNHATAQLLAAIARAPQGAVVLPGLDLLLDEAAWQAIGGNKEQRLDASAGHPQYTLHRLLRTLQVERSDVVEIGKASPALCARRHLLSEALRPADTTEAWQSFSGDVASALQDITLVEASDEREEALSIALMMREALETPGKTASLITPDRSLANRVRAELARWQIKIDDSGGAPLATTPEGGLSALLVEAAVTRKPGLPLLSLLSHPYCRLGRQRVEMDEEARLLDIAVLRLPLADDADLPAAIVQAEIAAQKRDAHPAVRALDESQWARLRKLGADVESALAPLRALEGEHSLNAFAKAHLACLDDLLRGVTEATPAAAALDDLLAELQTHASSLMLRLEDYALLFDQIARETTVRGAQRAHPRLKILGLLEARLLPADLVILGGLDEALWPPQSQVDAFLNRPMRIELGLSSPERRIGQTAHDFSQAMGNGTIVITRALKRGGSPTVPSRFLQRIAALSGEAAWTICKSKGTRILQWARKLDGDGESGERGQRPMPMPSVHLRPTSLSVTRIETLRRDPYAIYAERILRLKPLEAIGAEAGARESGILLHDVLAKFTNDHPKGALPADAATALLADAREAFAELMKNAEFRAFVWPRHVTALTKFVDWEQQRRMEIIEILPEQKGALALTLDDGSEFTLSGVADRIDRLRDGTLDVLDYKSGRVPTAKEIKAGFAPQLTLEAAMIERGAFKIPAQAVDSATYLKLGGSRGFVYTPVKAPDTMSFRDLSQEQFDGLVTLLNQFRKETTAYMPRPYPQFINEWGTYDHLARVREWSTAGSAD